jgi:hypothetical protein
MADINDVITELTEMKALGMHGAAKAAKYAASNPAEIEGYLISMDVSEVADLLISIA